MIPEEIFRTVRAAIEQVEDSERKSGMIDTFVLFETGWKLTPAYNLHQQIRDLKKELGEIKIDRDIIKRKSNLIGGLQKRIEKYKELLTTNKIKH